MSHLVNHVELMQDEIAFWRQSTACYIALARYDLERLQRGEEPLTSPQARLREHVRCLQAASDGEFFQRCEACGKPVRPGQAVVSSAEVGEIHAQPCMGAPDEQVKQGRMPADPETIEREDEDDPAEAAEIAADPHFSIHASEPALSQAQVLAELMHGAAILKQIEDCVPLEQLDLGRPEP